MNGGKNHNINHRPDKRVNFLLCGSCFWCASYLDFDELSITRCPVCQNNRMEQLPLSIRPVLHITPLLK